MMIVVLSAVFLVILPVIQSDSIAQGPDRWGNDVRIGNRDYIREAQLAVHKESGNLFAAILYVHAGLEDHLSLYHSTDGGRSWNETWNETIVDIKSMSATVVGNHCYVAYQYIFMDTSNPVHIQKFNAITGEHEKFSGGENWISIFYTMLPIEIEEIKLFSNQDSNSDRLYLFAISSEGDLRYFWDDWYAETWVEVTTGVDDANRGLDACLNEGADDYRSFVSYIDETDSLHIRGHGASSWGELLSRQVDPNAEVTAVSAYRDSVVCVFEDYNDSHRVCKKAWSNNGGLDWDWDYLDSPDSTYERPDVTLRDGGGGLIYRLFLADSERDGRFQHRLPGGDWSSSQVYADHQIYWSKPSIEHLGDGIYGIIYLSLDSPQHRAAYFDRSDWAVGIEDSQPAGSILPKAFSLSQNYPNPFNPSTTIAFDMPGVSGEKKHVEVTVYDIRGRRVKMLVDSDLEPGSHRLHWDGQNDRGEQVTSGIYLYTLKAGEEISTRKMTILK